MAGSIFEKLRAKTEETGPFCKHFCTTASLFWKNIGAILQK